MSEIGTIRQSAVLTTYGPGAIIDFRVPGTGAAVSVVAAGLESWEEEFAASNASSQDMKRFREKRLCDKLGVSSFRLPPVAPEKLDKEPYPLALVGVRFPRWLQCPECNIIMPNRKWGVDPLHPESRYCGACSNKKVGGKKAYVVPVRFVVACRDGHLDDFPWEAWVHNDRGDCGNKKKFKLESRGPGLAGLILSCDVCKSERSLEAIFQPGIHNGRDCSCARPWLRDADEKKCDQHPVTMQRGASNLYFPRFDSALVIPPWSEEVISQLGYHWDGIHSKPTADVRKNYIEIIWNEIEEDCGGLSMAAFIQLVEEKVKDAAGANSGNLRWDEYQQFLISASRQSRSRDEFEVRPEAVPQALPHLSHLLRVVSLREIRALKSFTRIEALPGSPPVKSQPLSHSNINWLPAIEVRGEGIFLALDLAKVREWEQRPQVRGRAAKLATYRESAVLNPEDSSPEVTNELGARYLLIHALSHVLMRQLSLQCGYSSASLREMIYVGDGDKEMAGVMIYTATSDSDGTLGGLQRQGQSERFGAMFVEAIRANEWCASDPLCIKGLVSASESSNLAACHSCLLAPETSCQDFNRFLDRAMLIGTPEDPTIGFFSDLLNRNPL